jgi:hypothetical protein
MNICIDIAAVYLIIMAFATHTGNFISALIFKVTPFFLGLGLGFISLKTYGLL